MAIQKITYPDKNSGFVDSFDSGNANQIKSVVNANADEFVNVSNARRVATVADLKAFTFETVQTDKANFPIHLLGYNEPGDGGGGLFYVDTSDTTTPDDGGTVFVTTGGLRIKRLIDSDISPLWFGAKLFPEDSINEFRKAADAARLYKKGLAWDGKFKWTGSLDISDITVTADTEITFDSVTDTTAMVATGSRGGNVALGANAERGSNVIVCAGLISDLSTGDILHLFSNKPFYPGSTVQGELCQVRDVDTNTNEIFLSKTLNDTYLTADSATLALVNPTKCNILGDVRITNVFDSVTRFGLNIVYGAYNKVDRITVINCKSTSVRFSECYAPDVIFYSSGADRDGLGYSLSIVGPTCYGTFRGVGLDARHVVSTSTAGLSRGVSWENHITVLGGGGRANSIFDSHGDTGSIYWDDCVAYGGRKFVDSDQVETSPGAIQSGARYNYINNFTAIQCGIVFNIRPSGEIDTYVINGFTLNECQSTFFDINGPTGIKNIHVSNGKIYNSQFGHFISSVSDATTKLESLRFENIFADDLTTINNTAFLFDGSRELPSKMEFVNVTPIRGIRSSSTSRAIRLSSSYITEIVFKNCFIGDFSELGRIESFIPKIVFDNVELGKHNIPIWSRLAAGTAELKREAFGEIVFKDSTLDTSEANSTAYGLVLFDNNFQRVDKLRIINSNLEADNVLSKGSTELGEGYVYNSEVPKLTQEEENATYLKYISGNKGDVAVIEGAGSPENVVAASIMSTFRDRATNDIYYKSAGNRSVTGWRLTKFRPTLQEFLIQRPGTLPPLDTDEKLVLTFQVERAIETLSVKGAYVGDIGNSVDATAMASLEKVFSFKLGDNALIGLQSSTVLANVSANTDMYIEAVGSDNQFRLVYEHPQNGFSHEQYSFFVGINTPSDLTLISSGIQKI